MLSSDSASKGDTPALIAKVAALQNLKEYAELNWNGSFVRPGRVHRQQEAPQPL
jgi:hypothetical protein